MNGRKLLAILQSQPDSVLDNYDLSVKIGDEFFSFVGAEFVIDDPDADGILDDGSPVIVLDSEFDAKW